jgi:hypothetical protein
MKRYYFYNPRTMAYALDIYGKDMNDAKKRIRKFLGTKRLSVNIEIWEANN